MTALLLVGAMVAWGAWQVRDLGERFDAVLAPLDDDVEDDS